MSRLTGCDGLRILFEDNVSSNEALEKHETIKNEQTETEGYDKTFRKRELYENRLWWRGVQIRALLHRPSMRLANIAFDSSCTYT